MYAVLRIANRLCASRARAKARAEVGTPVMTAKALRLSDLARKMLPRAHTYLCVSVARDGKESLRRHGFIRHSEKFKLQVPADGGDTPSRMSRSERSATTGIAFTARSTGIHATNPLRTDKFDLLASPGLEPRAASACPDGLWQRPASEYLDFVKQNGFNAIRLPLAADTILADPEVGKWSLTANTDWRGLSSLALLERIVKLAAKRGLLILLDLHRLHANVWPTAHGVWHDEEMPANKLEEAWRIVAKRFCRYWNIFAADLFNEPWGATWGDGDEERDWPLYASRLGDIVLQECPRWLVFVEGVGAGPRALRTTASRRRIGVDASGEKTFAVWTGAECASRRPIASSTRRTCMAQAPKAECGISTARTFQSTHPTYRRCGGSTGSIRQWRPAQPW